MLAGIDGHGPRDANGVRSLPGILQGGDIVWVAQDYQNLVTTMWTEEFVPRFAHLPFVTMNAQHHFVQVHGLGTLYMRPATVIRGIRGIGKRLKGVILDEAAWYNLESALKDVVLPALLDNDGWLMIMSTTNRGPDGALDDAGNKRSPSYFNLICEQIRKGERGAEWAEFTGTAFDNPRLSPRAINELIAEYTPGDPSLEQEVYAKLLKGGVGLALPQVCEARHIVPRFTVPAHWPQFGAFDWGFNHPYAFGWFASDGDGGVVLIDTVWGRKEQPHEILYKVKQVIPTDRLRVVIAGNDCWDKQESRGLKGPTIAERFAEGKVPLTRAVDARVAGLNNLRLYTAWEKTDAEPERVPRFRMMDTEGNRKVLSQLEAMQTDPDRIEDALKVDANYAGDGGDDGYDMVRYGLMSRPLVASAPKPERVKREDHARPYDYERQRWAEEPNSYDELDEPESRRHTVAVRMPRVGR